MSEPRDRLPDDPVVAWRESRSPWWAFGLLVLLDGVEHRREVSISSGGIRADNRFLPWHDIESIVEADDPALATVHLTDGDVVLLDRWHLPSTGAHRAKAERLGVLQRAFAASRGTG